VKYINPVPVVWCKSSHSMAAGECVEVAQLNSEHAGIRDSKAKQGPVIEVTSTQWRMLSANIKIGKYDI
jgi:Domain of unknown function (DUF397)